MNNSAVEIIQVEKQFGQHIIALKNVNLSIGQGEFFSLLGPSGCGKTTLLRMIAGFEEPTSGKILVSGKDMTGVRPHKRPVNMVFQSYALFPHLSVFDNIAFGLHQTKTVSRVEIPDRVKEALNLVRLDQMGDRYPSQLSGGQQQRVALARAIVNRPTVLLLDEPLSALDSKIRQEMQEELARLKREIGITFVMVTHDQGEALALSNRLAVLYQGNLEQVGSPEEIYEQPRTPFVADFIGQSNLMPARIAERHEKYLSVVTDCGLTLWVKDSLQTASVSIGSTVTAWMRTGSVKLIPVVGKSLDQLSCAGEHSTEDESGEPLNSFSAAVTNRSYQGTSTDYRLETKGGFGLKVTVAGDKDQAFAVGDMVIVHLPAKCAGVLLAV